MNRLNHAVVIITMIFLCSCNHDMTMQIKKAMKVYDRLILNMDADSLANLYTIDGELGKEAIGRDSIRNFLKSFKDIKVLDYQSETKSIIIYGNTAQQIGTYRQKVAVKYDTLELKGKYSTMWMLIKGNWLIKKMSTTPE
jgi:hypothetical protein